MFPNFPPALIIFFMVLCFFGILRRYRADKDHVRELQAQATRAFESVIIGSHAEKYRLNGKTAVVEKREEAGGLRGAFERTADFAVTIYAKNEYGERFLFKWNSKSSHRPFIKHLPQQRAHATDTPVLVDERSNIRSSGRLRRPLS